MKDLKISEELMSRVLNYEVNTFLGIVENEIDYNCCKDINEGYIDISINLYEFAFKCKEWMVTQGYGIKTETYDYMEDDSFSGTYWHIIKLRAKNYKDKGCPNCGANASEIEAIIKACEWILSGKCKLDKLREIYNDLTFSLDEDYWTLDSDEIEDRIQDYIEHESTPKEEIKVYIGKAIKKTHKDYVHTKQLLSSIQEYAYDNSGEYADNYLESLSPEIINNLGKLIIDYMDEYIEQPRWYNIENWVECTVDEFRELVNKRD